VEGALVDDKAFEDLLKCSRALLLMELRRASKPEDQLKPEVVLARAGFTAREIADMVGKNQAAVAKTIQRGGTAA
jgi:hypothetical protein